MPPSPNPTTGVFIWGGQSGDNTRVVQTSPDAAVWTIRTTPFDDAAGSIFGVGALDDRAALVGYGEVDGDGQNDLASADNGATWEVNPTPGFSFDQGNDVLYVDELGKAFFFLGRTGEVIAVATIADVLTWTAKSSPFDSGAAWRGCYAPALGMLAVVGFLPVGGDQRIITSVDEGETWTVQEHGGPPVFFYDIAWSPALGLFCAVGTDFSNAVIYTSPDGVTWTQQTAGFDPGTGQLNAVVWDDTAGVFMVGSNNIEAAYSSDGETWSVVSTTLANVFGIAAGNGVWVAVGYGFDGSPVYTVSVSTDGVTWTRAPTPLDGAQAYDVAFAATAEPPGAPTLDSANASGSDITLSWTPPVDEGTTPITNYRIYRGTTLGGEVLLAEVGAVTGYVDSDVLAGTTYFYKVSAVNA